MTAKISVSGNGGKSKRNGVMVVKYQSIARQNSGAIIINDGVGTQRL